MRIRTPRKKPTGTPRPKKTIVEAMKDASKVLPKRGQTPPKNVFTGQTKPTRISPITGKPVKRKPTGTPRPRTTTPQPPETRALADARRMSPNIDTRMKQLSIDRGRTKGAKSTVMDKSLGIDERMGALARERRAKGQLKSKPRAALDARKKAIATARSRARAIASLRGLGNKAVKGSSLNRNVTGIRRAIGARVGRK